MSDLISSFFSDAQKTNYSALLLLLLYYLRIVLTSSLQTPLKIILFIFLLSQGPWRQCLESGSAPLDSWILSHICDCYSGQHHRSLDHSWSVFSQGKSFSFHFNISSSPVHVERHKLFLVQSHSFRHSDGSLQHPLLHLHERQVTSLPYQIWIRLLWRLRLLCQTSQP